MLTTEQHTTLRDILYTVPVGSVKRIDYGTLSSSADVRINLEIPSVRGADPYTRSLRIKPDGTITEKQEVEVKL